MAVTPYARDSAWVVKLGGSLAYSRPPLRWLEILTAAAGRVVIVPGGGPFADQVRAMQRRWRLDDATAHRQALLAMEQYGLGLAALHPALRPASSRGAIIRVRRAGLTAVWLPTAMATGRPDIAENWDVTSDSLAAWLAGDLGIDRLVLVKSAPVATGAASAAGLVAAGMVDAALPEMLRRTGVACWCVNRRRTAAMARALRIGGDPGLRVICQG